MFWMHRSPKFTRTYIVIDVKHVSVNVRFEYLAQWFVGFGQNSVEFQLIQNKSMYIVLNAFDGSFIYKTDYIYT